MLFYTVTSFAQSKFEIIINDGRKNIITLVQATMLRVTISKIDKYQAPRCIFTTCLQSLYSNLIKLFSKPSDRLILESTHFHSYKLHLSILFYIVGISK